MEPGVPRSLRIAAAISWRVLVLGLAVFILGLAVAKLRLVFLAVFLALLGTTFLAPVAAHLRERRFPPAAAAAVSILVALVVVGGVTAAVAPQVVGQLNDLDVSVTGGVNKVQDWLVDGPFDLTQTRVSELFDRVEQEIRESGGVVASGALSGAMIVFEIVAALLIALVLLFFFLKDGSQIWSFLVGLFPVEQRDDVREMGERAWTTLGGFLRGTAIVAAVDAIFIGLALWILGVPLVLPLAVLTFFGAFIPIAGAVVAGFAAAMVALVSNGLTSALLVVGATILVQQLESNLLQPFVVGRNVKLHPVAVLLAVTIGGVLWGVLGAFVAVPVTAGVWAAIAYLRARPAIAGP